MAGVTHPCRTQAAAAAAGSLQHTCNGTSSVACIATYTTTFLQYQAAVQILGLQMLLIGLEPQIDKVGVCSRMASLQTGRSRPVRSPSQSTPMVATGVHRLLAWHLGSASKPIWPACVTEACTSHCSYAITLLARVPSTRGRPQLSTLCSGVAGCWAVGRLGPCTRACGMAWIRWLSRWGLTPHHTGAVQHVTCHQTCGPDGRKVGRLRSLW